MSVFRRQMTVLGRVLRKNSKPEEKLLWQYIRASKFHFRRQHRIGQDFFDFYSASVRLAIEVGPEPRPGRDNAVAYIHKIKILRVPLEDIRKSPMEVEKRVFSYANQLLTAC